MSPSNMYFLLALIFAFSRLLPLYIGRKTLNHDSYFYLLRGRNMRRRITGQEPKRILNDDVTLAPPLFSGLLSLIPHSFFCLINYLPLFVEMVNLVILLLFFDAMRVALSEQFLLSLLFIFNPLYLSLYSGPRTFKPTPRLLSEVLFNGMMLSLFLFLSSGSLLFFLLAVLLGAMVFLTNRFGIQVMLLLLLPVGIITHSLPTILLPFAAFALACMVYPAYWTLAKEHYYFVKNYCTNVQFHHPIIKARKRFKLQVLKEDGLKRFLASLLLESDWYNLFVKNYFGILVLLLFLFFGVVEHSLVLWWFLVALVLFLLTITRYLRFLGEAERYLLYGGMASLLLLAQYPLPLPVYWLLFTVNSIYWLLILVGIFLIEREPLVLERELQIRGVSACIAKKKLENILPIDATFPWEVIYLTDAHFVGFASRKERKPKFYLKMRLPVTNLAKLRKQYTFDAILVNKEYKKPYAKALKTYTKLFENGRFELYRC